MPKGDYVKLVIDAWFLDSVTDLTNYSWPLEPVQMLMTRVNGDSSLSVIRTAYTIKYHWVQKLNTLFIGGRQYTSSRVFLWIVWITIFPVD